MKTRKNPLYQTWADMKRRCSDPSRPDFVRYGGRGIRVCDRWQTFANFEADMRPRPPGTTLDRKDNNRGYDPDNCVWATRTRQQTNRRDTRLVHNVPLRTWAVILKCSVNTIRQRYQRGCITRR